MAKRTPLDDLLADVDVVREANDALAPETNDERAGAAAEWVRAQSTTRAERAERPARGDEGMAAWLARTEPDTREGERDQKADSGLAEWMESE